MSHGRGRAGSWKDQRKQTIERGKGRTESSSDHDIRRRVVRVDSETQTHQSTLQSTYNNQSYTCCKSRRGSVLEMGIKNMEVIDEDTIIQTVEILKRPGQTLGFYIREGNGIDKFDGVFISRIATGSVVENNGLLRIGDEILSVNTVDVGNVSLDDVVILMSIPKKLILKIRTRRSSTKNASCPSLSTLDQDEPPVVIVKKGRSSSATALEITERCPGELTRDTSVQYDSAGIYGTSRARGFPSYLRRAELYGTDIPVDGTVDLSPSSKAIQTKSSADYGTQFGPGQSYIDYSPRPSRSRSRYAKDYVEINLKRDYSSDSEVRTYAERRIHDGQGIYAAKHQDLRQVVTDDEDSYGYASRLSDVARVKQSKYKPVSPEKYNSDLDTYGSKKLGSVTALSDSEAGYVSSISAVDAEGRSNSLPRMDGGESNDEIRHWLRKFDTLSHDLEEELITTEKNTAQDIYSYPIKVGDTVKKECYTSEEYSSWAHLKASPGMQRKSLSHQNEHPKIVRQWSADSSLLHHPGEPVDHPSSVSDNPQEYRPPAQLANQPIYGRTPKISRSYSSTTTPKVKPQEPEPSSKGLPQYLTRMRDLHLTRKPVQVKTEEHVTYRTERRTKHHHDDKTKGVDGLLSVYILSGHGLKSSSTMLRDLYCIVEIDTVNKARTMIRTGAVTFDWDEPFDLDLDNSKELVFLIYNWDPNNRHKLCFYGVINLPFLLQCGKNHKLALRLEPKGILYLELAYKEPAELLQRIPSLHKTALFGVDLEVVVRREKSGLRIPIIVKKCIDEIDRRGLDVIGIYRLCGSAKRKAQLKDEFERNTRSVDLSPISVSDINVITGLLKDFLRELPEPLFTSTLYDMLLDSMRVWSTEDAGCSKLIGGFIDCLPKVNQDTMVTLINHLKRVMMKSDVNKMTSHNLAICFGPVLMCPAPTSATDIQSPFDIGKQIQALKFLLDIWPEGKDSQHARIERSKSMERAVEKSGSPKHSQTSGSPKISPRLPKKELSSTSTGPSHSKSGDAIYAEPKHRSVEESERLYMERELRLRHEQMKGRLDIDQKQSDRRDRSLQRHDYDRESRTREKTYDDRRSSSHEPSYAEVRRSKPPDAVEQRGCPDGGGASVSSSASTTEKDLRSKQKDLFAELKHKQDFESRKTKQDEGKPKVPPKPPPKPSHYRQPSSEFKFRDQKLS
ncbi:rho GTPase-activating protein 100F-like [Tubulanus polymorphus]|uniref:rho GTPase-activating protein 100F-like n=1 Tax=Tubulanus polymorphus TaxID=672921 RepID=UPI003DA6B5EB